MIQYKKYAIMTPRMNAVLRKLNEYYTFLQMQHETFINESMH
jgi:hypothetical protein